MDDYTLRYKNRILHLVRLSIICLVLISGLLLYLQTARSGELDLSALRADVQTGLGTSSALDLMNANQVEFVVNNASQAAPVTQRLATLAALIQRGAIYDRNGRQIAFDRKVANGLWERVYTGPFLGHALGFVSELRIGVSGIERSYNNQLLGLDRPDASLNQLLRRTIKGSDLILTIDSPVQQAVETALGNRSGAVVVLDEHTGAVLAMVSSSGFDPNRIHEPGYLDHLLIQCDGAADCTSPLVNRASQAIYPPGSLWSTIPLIAALDTGQVTPDTVFDFGQPLQGTNGTYYIYSVDGGEIFDPNQSEAQLDLTMSYARSALAAFAKLGDQIPPNTLLDYAKRFGFGKPGEIPFPLEIEYTPSQIARDPEQLSHNNLLRASTAIGQGEVMSSPLNMAMIILSIVNNGQMPVPYFVQAVRDPSGVLVEPTNRHTLEGIMQPSTAQAVRQMMISSVAQGSGQSAAVPGLIVGGTSGTAQVSGGVPPHAWFSGFAEVGDRGIVIVVMIENGGEGSKIAAPIFADVARAALRPVVNPQPIETGSLPSPQAAVTQTPIDAGGPAAAVDPTQLPSLPPSNPTAIVILTPTDLQPTIAADVPTPEITRDPTKKDLTAENPTCGADHEVPKATGEFIWPSSYQALSGGNFREGHPGFDLAAPPGSPVYAADTGLVVFAGWSGSGYGNTILIDHGNGFRTLYAHLSRVSTFCGAKVEKGKIIGMSGSTGNSSGPHLHFEVRVPGGYINPLKVLPTP